MKGLIKKLKDAAIVSATVCTGTLGLLNMMSYEPFIMLAPPDKKIEDFNAHQYAQEFPFGKTLGYLSYPGAKVGQYYHNKRVKEWNSRQTQP